MHSTTFEALKSALRKKYAHEVLCNWSVFNAEIDSVFAAGGKYLHHELTRPWTDDELSFLEGCPSSVKNVNDEDQIEILVTAHGDFYGYLFNADSLAETSSGQFLVEIFGVQMYEIESQNEPTRFRDLTATWKIQFSIDSETKRATLSQVGEFELEHTEAEY